MDEEHKQRYPRSSKRVIKAHQLCVYGGRLYHDSNGTASSLRRPSFLLPPLTLDFNGPQWLDKYAPQNNSIRYASHGGTPISQEYGSGHARRTAGMMLHSAEALYPIAGDTQTLQHDF